MGSDDFDDDDIMEALAQARSYGTSKY